MSSLNVAASSNRTDPDLLNIIRWEFQVDRFLTAEQEIKYPKAGFVPSVPETLTRYKSTANLSGEQIVEKCMNHYVQIFRVNANANYASHYHPNAHMNAKNEALDHCEVLIKNSKNVSNPQELTKSLTENIEKVYKRICITQRKKLSNLIAKSKTDIVNGFENSMETKFGFLYSNSSKTKKNLQGPSKSIAKRFCSTEQIDKFIKNWIDQCDILCETLQNLHSQHESKEVESTISKVKNYIADYGKKLNSTNNEHVQATRTYLEELLLSLNGNYIKDIENKPFDITQVQLLNNIAKDKANILGKIGSVCHKVAVETEMEMDLKGEYERKLDEREKTLKQDYLMLLEQEQRKSVENIVEDVMEHVKYEETDLWASMLVTKRSGGDKHSGIVKACMENAIKELRVRLLETVERYEGNDDNDYPQLLNNENVRENPDVDMERLHASPPGAQTDFRTENLPQETSQNQRNEVLDEPPSKRSRPNDSNKIQNLLTN